MFFRIVFLSLGLFLTACTSNLSVDTTKYSLTGSSLLRDDLFSRPVSSQNVNEDSLYQLPEQVKNYLDENIAPLATRLDKFIALRDWVYQEVADFEYDTGTTVSIKELGTAKKINCFSFSILFVAAARYVNVPAEIHLIETPPSWDADSQRWIYLQHISVITKLRGFFTKKRLETVIGASLEEGYADQEPLWWNLRFITDINRDIYAIPEHSQELTDKQVLARFYNNKAVESIIAGDLNLAYHLNKQALLVDNRSAEAWNNLGVIYSTANILQEAQLAYANSISLNPNTLSAYNNLYSIYTRLGEVDKAVEIEEQIDFHRQKNPYYHYELGKEEFAAGHYEQAIEHYQTAVRQKSDEPDFYLALAKAYIKLENQNLATKNFFMAKQLTDNAGGQMRANMNSMLLSNI